MNNDYRRGMQMTDEELEELFARDSSEPRGISFVFVLGLLAMLGSALLVGYIVWLSVIHVVKALEGIL